MATTAKAQRQAQEAAEAARLEAEEAKRSQVLTLREQGRTFAEIAQITGLDFQEAIDTLSNKDTYRVQTHRAVMAELAFSKRQLDKEGRIAQLADLRDRLNAELQKRDLSDIPTDKLVNLILKTSDTLGGEVYTPTINTTSQQRKRANLDIW